MAKLTRHLCDFCGGALGRPSATLAVPLPKDDGKHKPRPEAHEHTWAFAHLFGGLSANTGKSRNFDMCLSCAEGLTRWRHAAIEKLIEAGFEKELA